MHSRFSAHAYLIEGGFEKIPAVLSWLAAQGVDTEANPDILLHEYKLLRVDDARVVREKADLRAVRDEGRIFILVAPNITTEAQNALLKVLEEPRAGATFFLVVASPLMLLPTLRSRCTILELEASQESGVSVQKFLSSDAKARIELMKPLYLHDEDDERDIRGALAFLRDLEKTLASRVTESSVREGIRAVYRARKYATDKGSLLKALLEHVALLVPRM